MESEIRRLQSTLAISGIAYIAFGFWFIVKVVMLLIISPDQLRMHASELFGSPMDTDIVFHAALIILFVLMVIGLVMRLYVGLSAFLESRGRRCGTLYVIIAAIAAVSGIVSTVQAVIYSSSLRMLLGDFIPGIVDLISLLALIDLTIAAIRLRRITRASERQE